MSVPLILGRVEKVQLTEDDYVLISDAVGGRIKITPGGACGLYNALGRFLATNAIPLPAPTRKDFKEMSADVHVGPDCRDGKHKACHGDAWCEVLDAVCACVCDCHEVTA